MQDYLEAIGNKKVCWLGKVSPEYCITGKEHSMSLFKTWAELTLKPPFFDLVLYSISTFRHELGLCLKKRCKVEIRKVDLCETWFENS